MVVKTPVYSTTYSALTSPLDIGSILLLEDGDGFPIDGKFLVSLQCAVELAMGRVVLEDGDHVIKVIDGNSNYFATVEVSPGNQALNMAKSVHSDFCYPGLVMKLAQLWFISHSLILSLILVLNSWKSSCIVSLLRL